MHNQKPASDFPPHGKLVFLVSIILLMNYIDRGNLATAAPLVKTELGLDDGQIGVLLSSFYWTYVAFMIPVGWATERFGAHRVLAVGAALWSLATLLTGFAPGLSAIFLLRLLLATSAIAPSDRLPSCGRLIAFAGAQVLALITS